MALGERKFGFEKTLDNFISDTIRSGIGCAVVINKQIVPGENNLCGEIEYWKCPGDTKDGKLPELGELVSSSGIIAQISQALENGETSILNKIFGIQDVIHAFLEGDSLSKKIVEESIATLAWALGQMSLMLAPQQFVMAGDFTALADSWLLLLRKGLSDYYEGLPMQPPIIRLSSLGDDCAALGAASMAIQNWRLNR